MASLCGRYLSEDMKRVKEAARGISGGQFFLIEGVAKTDVLRQKYFGRTWGLVGLGGLNKWEIKSGRY